MGHAFAEHSTIVEAEGCSCMGRDKSMDLTEKDAIDDARRRAAEYACTYIKSVTDIKDLQIEKDLVNIYSGAKVRTLQELERRWYRDANAGQCFRIRIEAEVIPDQEALAGIAKGKSASEDPLATLTVRIWTDKQEYKASEKVRIYLQGNKPFYARVIYKDAAGQTIQLLPNPYRTECYFHGGSIYEIPSGNDRFELEVNPPFGEEDILVLASTVALGDLSLEPAGGVYEVKTKGAEIGMVSRSLKLKPKTDTNTIPASEFFESRARIKTTR